MPLESLPALLLALAIVVAIVVVLPRLRGGADDSIAMWLIRRIRGEARPAAPDDHAGPDLDEIAARVGAAGPRPERPTRIVTVEAPPRAISAASRPVASRGVRRVAPDSTREARPDPRIRLWRDTSIVTVAIGFVVILSAAILPPGPEGEVLGATFPPIVTIGPSAPAAGADPTPTTTAPTNDPTASHAVPAAQDPTVEPTPPTQTPRPTARPTSRPTPGSSQPPGPTPEPPPTPTPAPAPTPEPPPTPTPEPPPAPTPEPPPTPTPEPPPTPTPEPPLDP